jgi:Spy/CpxP family protein refolding chaperone
MKLRRQLDAEILSDSPDEQQIDTLRQQLVQAHGEELSRQIALQRKIAQVLTPEQRATARERIEQPRGRRGH